MVRFIVIYKNNYLIKEVDEKLYINSNGLSKVMEDKFRVVFQSFDC